MCLTNCEIRIWKMMVLAGSVFVISEPRNSVSFWVKVRHGSGLIWYFSSLALQRLITTNWVLEQWKDFFKKDGKIKMLLAFRASLATYLMDWELWRLIISCISKKKSFCGELLTYFSFSFRLNVSCCCRSVWYVEGFGWVDWHVSLHILNFSIQLMGSSAVNNNRRCLLTQLYFTFSVNKSCFCVGSRINFAQKLKKFVFSRLFLCCKDASWQ